MENATNPFINGIKPGSRVSWTSQAGGHSVTKEGDVVYVGPAGTFKDLVRGENMQYWASQEAWADFARTLTDAKNRITSDRCTSGIIVKVDRKKGSHSTEMRVLTNPLYYAPLKSKLETIGA